MFGDYKYGIYLEAEELAEETYGVDYYSLPNDKQYEVYTAAESAYWDKRISAAERD